MATIQLPTDFKDFLKLLNSEKVEYLLIGGFAVAFYGYPRATGDMDIWIAASPQNIPRVVAAMERFGFAPGSISAELFRQPDNIIRMGVPPLRIELLTKISGCEFAICYDNGVADQIDGVDVMIIGIEDLKANKLAAGRTKDLNDLENLP